MPDDKDNRLKIALEYTLAVIRYSEAVTAIEGTEMSGRFAPWLDSEATEAHDRCKQLKAELNAMGKCPRAI